MASLLIVDDDEIIRNTLSDLFSEEHLCHTARTGEEALTRLQAQDYDLIITDISMPGMTGEDLLGLIKIYSPRTLVIFITGLADKTYAERLRNRGAFDYLLKPFPLEVIEERVARAIESRR